MSETKRAPARCPWLFDQPYAHRGLWLADGPPENSMAAFEAAARAQLGVELDVRASSDAQPVVIHDARLERTADSAGLVAAYAARELTSTPLKGGGAIPHLAEVLGAFPETPLLVEMKVNPGEEGPLEASTAALLKRHAGPVAVMSFNPRALAHFASAAGKVARGQLTSGFTADPGPLPTPLPASDSAGCETSRPDFLSCNVDALVAYGASAAKRLGLPLIAWTVRTPMQLALARQLARTWIFEALPVESVALAR